MLFLFSLSTMMSAIAWICQAVLFELLIALYGTSLAAINYLSGSYMIWFAPLILPSISALDKYGLRFGVCLGIGGTAIGMAVKCFVNYGFAWVLIGQTICAIAQPCLYNAPAKVTSNWFAEEERTLATMIGTCANIFGISLGFLLPALFVDAYDSQREYSESELNRFKT